MTTFCWFPPDRWLTKVSGERGLDAQLRDLARRPAPSFRYAKQRRFVERADDDLADIEKDAPIEHEAVAPAVRGHEADASPRSLGGAAREFHARPDRSASPERAAMSAKQNIEQTGDARTFESGEAHDLA